MKSCSATRSQQEVLPCLLIHMRFMNGRESHAKSYHDKYQISQDEGVNNSKKYHKKSQNLPRESKTRFDSNHLPLL